MFGAGFEEPALELAFGGGAEALEFDDGVEEVGASCGEVGHLAGELLVQAAFVEFVLTLLKSADPERGETFPLR